MVWIILPQESQEVLSGVSRNWGNCDQLSEEWSCRCSKVGRQIDSWSIHLKCCRFSAPAVHYLAIWLLRQFSVVVLDFNNSVKVRVGRWSCIVQYATAEFHLLWTSSNISIGLPHAMIPDEWTDCFIEVWYPTRTFTELLKTSTATLHCLKSQIAK